jgi:hypothetical protein
MAWMILPSRTARSTALNLMNSLWVARHAAADHGTIEDIEGGEQSGGAVALVVVGHGAAFAGLHRQAGLGAVERLDLRFLVDRDDDGMDRRVHMPWVRLNRAKRDAAEVCALGPTSRA